MTEKNPYAPPQVEVTPSATEPESGYSYTVDPRGLTKTLLVMLGISLVVSIVTIVGEMMQLSFLETEFTDAEAEVNDDRQMIIGIAYILVFVVTGFVFLKWIRRANINSSGFGVQGMTFTPGWSIGYYFIPILNLFKPYQAMKEILQVSKDPRGWFHQSGGQLLGWWWGLWLASGVVSRMSTRAYTKATTVEEFQSASNLSIVDEVVSIILTIVAAILVRTIARNQEKLVNNS